MLKLIVALACYLFPAFVFAESSALSFAPPTTDYSVMFLANLFGVVDGVLHGTGSQIMGSMFMVFNSAVLALGGIVIMYTLIVSTMNTAHEGQMLGQKWSSIWIPLRSTLGLALLIPKASGYCLMQIFVMWVVVQGVGAADKVWDAALSYLNRGGVIIQTQTTNPVDVSLNPSTSAISSGAATILAGQVCMAALQKQLTAQRQMYLDDTKGDTGPCTTTALDTFCKSAVPDFINSVNAVAIQNADIVADSFRLSMPNIADKSSPYYPLNGICGYIEWNSIAKLNPSITPDKAQQQVQQTLTTDEYKTAQLSRAIAIQQMYVELSGIAQAMVGNDPAIGSMSPAEPSPDPKNFSVVASQQYGVPYAQGATCLSYDMECTSWGPYDSNFGVMFNGTELIGAVTDYSAIMMPTLTALARAAQPDTERASHDFITKASASGWLMAGSYFFDLVRLNANATRYANLVDDSSGLERSKFDAAKVTNAKDTPLGVWFKEANHFYPKLQQIRALVDGSGLPDGGKAMPSTTPSPSRGAWTGLASSTAYGYINNSSMLRLPGQPGIDTLHFADVMHFSVSGSPYASMDPVEFPCTGIYFGWPFETTWCVVSDIANLFYNKVLKMIVDAVSNVIYDVLQSLLNLILWLPLQKIGQIFKQGVTTISQPGINPIVALANMGVMYINFAGNLWIGLLMDTLKSAIFPPVFALMMLGLPLTITWLGIMVAISFVTAYYVPILPYLMFIFGGIGWLISVIEAMVAAPLVALGITHPEGHDTFGKGEAALMILMNVFLRPSMMIIGFIAAITLTYVGIWVLNAGFDHAIGYMQGTSASGDYSITSAESSGSGETQYIGWAGLFAFFFSVLTYTTVYLILVQKSFTLISFLPDKVLRWIGGTPESTGQEAAQWGEEAKSGVKESGDKAYTSQQQIGKGAGAGAQKGISWAKNKAQGAAAVSAQGESTPSKKD